MKDIEKFKRLFDDIGIRYKVENHSDEMKIDVDITAITDYPGSFGKALDIGFEKDGKFKGFEPWGE